MLKKLRIKFVCINMLIVTIMLVVVFSVLFLSTSHTMEAESAEWMRLIVENTTRNPKYKDKAPEVRRPYLAVRIGSNGEPEETHGRYTEFFDLDQLTEIVQATQKNKHDSGTLADYHLRFKKSSTSLGAWMVFMDTTNEQAALNNLIRNSLWIGLATFALFFAISIFLAHWAVKPVEKAWQQQKQFVGDASHELKTPLTVITTNAELLLEEGSEKSEKEPYVVGILTMCRRMRELVERMLDLARAGDGSNKTNFSRFDLSETVTNAALPFEPVFFERGIRFELNIAPGLCITGSEALMRQLTEILLDNAQKYASPGGEAHLSLQKKGASRCLLTVSNTGDPIPDEEIRHLFERFYRSDKARTAQKSYGLGLSIAQSIVSAHRGHIRAESKNGQNRFFAEFPI